MRQFHHNLGQFHHNLVAYCCSGSPRIALFDISRMIRFDKFGKFNICRNLKLERLFNICYADEECLYLIS